MKSPLDNWQLKYDAAVAKINAEKNSKDWIVLIGSVTCELAAGSKKVYDEFKKYINDLNNVYLDITGCTGFCVHEPIVQIVKRGYSPVRYKNVKPEDVKLIVEQHLKKGEVVEKLLLA